MLGQIQINENLTKKLASDDKILDNINSNLEGLTSSFTNQLSLNKMFEIQLAQLAAILLAYHFENISGQSEISFENVNVVITRDGKSTRDLPYPNHAGKAKKHRGTTLNNRLWASLGDNRHKVMCIRYLAYMKTRKKEKQS